MARVYDFFLQGGPVMWPLLALSIFTVTTALERTWFWLRLLSQEHRIVRNVLATARHNFEEAQKIAQQASYLPIGRFLLAPLNLKQPNPETFRLAMEGAGDKEFIQMRKGNRLLETVVAVAPLLGLLGTVIGLITTFGNLNIGGGGDTVEATKAAGGISEALIATAAGMVIAIVALLIERVLVVLQTRQIDYFTEVGTELELIYRQFWYEPDLNQANKYPSLPPSTSSVSPDESLSYQED